MLLWGWLHLPGSFAWTLFILRNGKEKSFDPRQLFTNSDFSSLYIKLDFGLLAFKTVCFYTVDWGKSYYK